MGRERPRQSAYPRSVTEGKQFTARLEAFADAVEQRLGPAVVVDRSAAPFRTVRIEPTRPDAIGVSWIEMDDKLVIDTGAGPGGRWNLGTSDRDIDLVVDIVESVIAGRVTERLSRAHSRVEITLSDGRRIRETGTASGAGCLPMFRRRLISYEPY